MNLRTKRRLLWIWCVTIAAAGLAAAVALVAAPVAGPDDSAAAVAGATARMGSTPPPARRPPLSAYEAASRRNFLVPLFDTPVAGQAALKPAVKLVGTIIEKDQSFAMLKAKDGQVRWAPVGEVVDGAEVLQIAADSVTVRFADQTFTLKVESQGPGS